MNWALIPYAFSWAVLYGKMMQQEWKNVWMNSWIFVGSIQSVLCLCSLMIVGIQSRLMANNRSRSREFIIPDGYRTLHAACARIRWLCILFYKSMSKILFEPMLTMTGYWCGICIMNPEIVNTRKPLCLYWPMFFAGYATVNRHNRLLPVSGTIILPARMFWMHLCWIIRTLSLIIITIMRHGMPSASNF